MLARITNNKKVGTGPALLTKQYNTPVALYSSDNANQSYQSQMQALSLSDSQR